MSPQQVVDGVAWGYVLARDEDRHAVVVIVKRHAMQLDDPDALSTETRAAIATRGRSEAQEAARLSDPPACVVLGKSG